MSSDARIQREIVPNNILMIRATGVERQGARRLAKIAHAPFIKVEASKFTEVGYVGRDVESMVVTGRSVGQHGKTGKRKEVRKRAEQIVEDIILDTLIPPVHQPARKQQAGSGDETGENDVSD